VRTGAQEGFVSPSSVMKCLYQVSVITVFTVFRLLTDFVCLYSLPLCLYWFFLFVLFCFCLYPNIKLILLEYLFWRGNIFIWNIHFLENLFVIGSLHPLIQQCLSPLNMLFHTTINNMNNNLSPQISEHRKDSKGPGFGKDTKMYIFQVYFSYTTGISILTR
jgi:hypothetical protein